MIRLAHTVRVTSMLVLVLLAGIVTAEPVYRSVDVDGNVTFSSTPPENAVAVDEVSVRPGPSAEAQRAARERAQRQEKAASDLGKARTDREPQQPAVEPAAASSAEHEDPGYYQYGYPSRAVSQRERIRERLQERPVQLPARPVQR